MTHRLFHACVAAIAAGLLASGCSKKKVEPVAEPKAEEPSAQQVRCEGANACKAQSDCHTAAHACAGQNACKGQGWVAMAPKDCVAKGGKVSDGPAKM